MKIKSLIMLTFVCLVCVTCKNADETCPVLPTTAPISSLYLKFVSKATGADLIFGSGAPYKLSDLRVTSSDPRSQPSLLADSAQKNNPFIIMIIGDGTQKLTLQLGTLPADTINAVFTTTQTSRCTSYTQISSISLDGKTFCSPCTTGNQFVTIKK